MSEQAEHSTVKPIQKDELLAALSWMHDRGGLGRDVHARIDHLIQGLSQPDSLEQIRLIPGPPGPTGPRGEPGPQGPPGPPGEATNRLNNDTKSDIDRALHRVCRAMHDGNCPECGCLRPSDTFYHPAELVSGRVVREARHQCPECGFVITESESKAAMAVFQPHMAKNCATFKTWLENWRRQQALAQAQAQVDVAAMTPAAERPRIDGDWLEGSGFSLCGYRAFLCTLAAGDRNAIVCVVTETTPNVWTVDLSSPPVLSSPLLPLPGTYEYQDQLSNLLTVLAQGKL